MELLQRLEASTARIEAKLHNAEICQRNSSRRQADPLLTILLARQKDVSQPMCIS